MLPERPHAAADAAHVKSGNRRRLARFTSPRPAARGRTGHADEALIDRASGDRGLGWAAVVTVTLIGLIAGMMLLPDSVARWLGVAALPVLAAVGVAAVFALALGVLTFSGRTQGDLLVRALADGDEDGLLLAEEDGRIIYANRAYADLTGAVGARDVRTVERIFGDLPDANEAVYRMTQQLAAGEGTTQNVRLPSGHETGPEAEARWLRLTCKPLRAGAGERAVTAWRISDVTEDRAAQEYAFRELQHAIDHLDRAPAGFVGSDDHGAVTYLNATLAEWTGIDLGGFVPRTLLMSDLFAEVSNEAVCDTELRVGGANTPVRLIAGETGSAGGARGTIVLARAQIASLTDTDGTVERMARLFDQSPTAIAAIDADGRVLETNRAFARLFDSEQTAGRPLRDVLGANVAEQVEPAFLAVASGGKDAEPIEVVTHGDDPTTISFELIGLDADDETGGRVVLYATDVSERRALEKRMEQGQKMEAVGQLAGGIAHDFNNVLTAIGGSADFLLENHSSTDPSWQDIMGIKQSVNRAASLVRQLLAFSRRQTLRPQVLSVPDALSDLSLMLRKLAGDRVDLSIRHGRDLWPVKADLGQIEQVIINLTVNARDAINDARSTGGAIKLATQNINEVEVRRRFTLPGMRPQDFVVLEVSDNGTGMSAETIASIFDPFFTTKEMGKGTGLGLSMVYGIVKQSGGHIHCESVLGEGTTFRIFLPRYVPRENEEPVNVAAAPKKEAARDLSGTATILFAEDEDAVRAIFVRTLESRGYTVIEADNGEDAWELAQEMIEDGETIDLVVSDVVMPEMDGPTLFRHMRELAPEVPFIFASGHAEDAFEKSLPDAATSEFGFLSKPYSVKQLLEVVKDATSGQDD